MPCPRHVRGFLCSYHQSLAQNMTDDELDILKSFRVPGRILFVRSAKDQRNQPCAPPPVLAPALDIQAGLL